MSTHDPSHGKFFGQYHNTWWDPDGPLKTLHDVNPVRLQFIERHLKLTNATVLDVGCGGGLLSESMAKAGALVTGIDIDASLIQAASTHGAAFTNLTYTAKPLETFTDENAGCFDAITCMEMLEHVEKPEEILQQCSTLLKPNGHLFLSTLNRHPKAFFLGILAAEYLFHFVPRGTHQYEKFITPSELGLLCKNVGLHVFAASGMSYNPLTRKASLSTDVSINYLLVARKISHEHTI